MRRLRLVGPLLDARSAQAIRRAVERKHDSESSALARFVAFLRREGLDVEERSLALRRDSRDDQEFVDRRFGYSLGWVAAACLVLSVTATPKDVERATPGPRMHSVVESGDVVPARTGPQFRIPEA